MAKMLGEGEDLLSMSITGNQTPAEADSATSPSRRAAQYVVHDLDKGEHMSDLIKQHYGKLVAFLAGWAADALVDLSSYVKALLP